MRVFVVEQAVPIEEEVDDYDATAIQYLAGIGSRAVGTARLVNLGRGVGKIGRVAVHQEWRGTGVGSSLVEHIIRTDGADCALLTLDSQLAAIPFYERFGFRATGDVFMDAGIPHRRMERSRSS